MNFKNSALGPMHKSKIGHSLQTQDTLFFFGNATATIETITAEFPRFRFKQIRQTHSTILLCARELPDLSTFKNDPLLPEGDALWTEEKECGLLIKTADCIPLLIRNRPTGEILAIHAGWRGIASGIIGQTLRGLGWQDLACLWGPHIQQDSFEVDADVANELRKSVDVAPSDSFISRNRKSYVNLLSLGQTQIAMLANATHLCCDIDTFTDSDYHSFRRDREQAGRNLSFVVRL
jgi:polyphenol oxidase